MVFDTVLHIVLVYGEKKMLDLFARPRGFAQKLETRLYGRVVIEAADIDQLPQFVPVIIIDQTNKDLFKGYTVERVFVSLFAHGDDPYWGRVLGVYVVLDCPCKGIWLTSVAGLDPICMLP
jgi:hypothetical protein